MSERPRLIQLPNGVWIATNTVTAIMPIAPSVGYTGRHYLASVTVCCGQDMHNFPFPGMDEARAYADELAGKVNADA